MFRWLLPLILLLPALASALPLRGYVGEARSRDGGRLLYEEHHLVRLSGTLPAERLVLYRCPDGRPFARKRVEHGKPALAPRFRLDDVRFGYVEGFSATGEAFVRRSAGAVEERERVAGDAALVVDAGFDAFVREHWTALAAGERARLPFLVPSRLAVYAFSLRRVGHEVLHGEPASVFRLSLGGILGWFADSIEVSYRDRDRRLMRFEGLTNIRADARRNLVARIDFPPAREDPAPPARAWQAALDEPLRDCPLGG